MNHLNIKQIEEIIPHRHPFFWWIILKIMTRVNLLSDINV